MLICFSCNDDLARFEDGVVDLGVGINECGTLPFTAAIPEDIGLVDLELPPEAGFKFPKRNIKQHYYNNCAHYNE